MLFLVIAVLSSPEENIDLYIQEIKNEILNSLKDVLDLIFLCFIILTMWRIPILLYDIYYIFVYLRTPYIPDYIISKSINYTFIHTKVLVFYISFQLFVTHFQKTSGFGNFVLGNIKPI